MINAGQLERKSGPGLNRGVRWVDHVDEGDGEVWAKTIGLRKSFPNSPRVYRLCVCVCIYICIIYIYKYLETRRIYYSHCGLRRGSEGVLFVNEVRFIIILS